MLRICIIGCGYVGQAAAYKWKRENHEITVTTRSLERAYALRPLADLVYILDDNWQKLVAKQDVVLLCIAPDAQSDYTETYLRSAEALVSAVKGSSVSQIIYTSSSSVYGDHGGAIVDENTTPKPVHANAQILLATEQTLWKAASDKRRVCLFRLGEIYGPGRSLVDRVKRLQHTFAPGDGENITNLVHLDEIISALDIALQKKLHGIYNLCNDIHLPRKILYQQICKENGWPDVQWKPEITTPHSGNKELSNTKLKSQGYATWTAAKGQRLSAHQAFESL